MVLAAVIGPKFLVYGKRKTMLWNNVLLLIGTAFSCIDVFWCMVFGRFLFGFAAGYFALACPKFLNEVIPIEYKGSFGSSVQFMVCLGIAVPVMLIAPVVDSPPPPTTVVFGVEGVNPEYSAWASTWGVTNYYQVIFALPAIFSLI